MKKIDCSFLGNTGERVFRETLEFEIIPRKGDVVNFQRHVSDYLVRRIVENNLQEELQSVIKLKNENDFGNIEMYVVDVIHYPKINDDDYDTAVTEIVLSIDSLD